MEDVNRSAWRMDAAGRWRLAFAALALAFLSALSLAAPSVARAAKTRRVSVSSAGHQGNGASGLSVSLSADGRFAAFTSDASNLVGGDTNDAGDIFVHDRRTGETARVSVNSAGAQASGNSGPFVGPDSYDPQISADGRFVAFTSGASNLVGDDTNGRLDAFVHDRKTGETKRVSVSSAGTQGKLESFAGAGSLSADGRFVAFYSVASNLVRGDTNRSVDVFVHDRMTDKTTLVSVSSAGRQGNGDSFDAHVSADGRFVAFTSRASNLVRNDTNGKEDIFVHDLKTGQTARVNVSSAGQQANRACLDPEISADGRLIAFGSPASNLVRRDTNRNKDVFVHNRQTGKTRRVSVSSARAQANGSSGFSAISVSAHGRFVAFQSDAANLVRRDTNRTYDIFVRDRKTGKTRRVSVSSAGHQGNATSDSVRISITPGGRFVGFGSQASNLVRDDTNGKAGAGGDAFVRGPLLWATKR